MVTLITKKLQSQCLDALAHKSYDTGLVSCPPWVRGRCPGWVSAGGGDGGVGGPLPREALVSSELPEPPKVVIGFWHH